MTRVSESVPQFVWTRAGRAAAVLVGALAVAGSFGCTQQQLQGQSASYLIIDSLQAASAADPSKMSSLLQSDVETNGSIFADPGAVTFSLGLKDPGAVDNPTRPTSANFVTVSRYHVQFVRTDGRNTPGVDVPYPFDGAITGTVSGSGLTTGFTVVRAQAKLEAPLKALVDSGVSHLSGGGLISTIAQVTFYGSDQAGRDVSVMGQISVDFANWADPQ
jgi:hypothetical protein